MGVNVQTSWSLYRRAWSSDTIGLDPVSNGAMLFMSFVKTVRICGQTRFMSSAEPGMDVNDSIVDGVQPKLTNRLSRLLSVVLLILSFFLTAFGDRMSQFVFPVFLADAFSSTGMAVPAAYSISEQISIFLLGPAVGGALDRLPRMTAVTTAILLQNAFVVLGSGVVIVPLLRSPGVWSVEMIVTVAVLCAVGFCKSLAGASSSVSVERDWIPTLCAGDAALLTRVNSISASISQLCAIASPMAMGLLLLVIPPWAVIATSMVWNVVSGFVEVGLLWAVYLMNPILRVPTPKPTPAPTDTTSHPTRPIVLAAFRPVLAVFSDLLQGARLWANDPVFLLSLAYCLLYFTILSPQSVLLTTYLIQSDVSPSLVAVFRVFAAVSALVTTGIAPLIFRRLGPKLSGFTAISWQLGILMSGVLAFVAAVYLQTVDDPPSAVKPVVAALLVYFLVTICISRLGLWLFDQAHLVMLQLRVDPTIRGAVSGTEKSVCSMALLSMLFLGMVLQHPRYVTVLVVGSLLSVGLAFVAYILWLGTIDRRGDDKGGPMPSEASVEGRDGP